MKKQKLQSFEHYYWFRILKGVHNATDCPEAKLPDCLECISAPCELVKSGEMVTLLPYEEWYIRNQLIKAGMTVPLAKIEHISNKGICPFLISQGQGKCGIHPYRPFDCRSYPIVPKFSGNGRPLEFYVSRGCPYNNRIPEVFIKLMLDLWTRLIAPGLPARWQLKYNRRNSNAYISEVNITVITK